MDSRDAASRRQETRLLLPIDLLTRDSAVITRRVNRERSGGRPNELPKQRGIRARPSSPNRRLLGTAQVRYRNTWSLKMPGKPLPAAEPSDLQERCVAGMTNDEHCHYDSLSAIIKGLLRSSPPPLPAVMCVRAAQHRLPRARSHSR